MASGRIFINYRRDDAPGVAGRLADALERWFGEGRVFRDVDGIQAGADFEAVLDGTAKGASAMVVVIGSRWLNGVDAQGQRRLAQADDWVAREIAWGLQRGVAVIPVLVDGAAMPRQTELPEALQPLTRLNALHLSDQRWASDVARLAQVVALDLPASRNQRLLWAAQWLVSLCLLLTLSGTAAVVAWDVVHGVTPPLARWISGISFIVITGASAVVLFVARLAEVELRPWLYAAAAAGLGCTLAFFTLAAVLSIDNPLTPIVMFAGSTFTGLLVLVLMTARGWRAP